MSRVPRRAGWTVALIAAAVAVAGCDEGSSVRAIEKSMEPAILSGEFVTVDFEAYERRPPAPGEIVALRAPQGAETEQCGVTVDLDEPCARPTAALSDLWLIKRIVAGPGQRVAIRGDGRAVIDGLTLPEPYMQRCPDRSCRMGSAITVPPGHWFVLGDNRPYSGDSRYWGPVPTAALEGTVTPPDPGRR